MNRHERRKAAATTRQVDAPASARERVMSFLSAFHEAPNAADIEIRGGFSATGEAAILVTISGAGDYGLMAHEARKIADIMEDEMRAHPTEPEAATLPNIIMALRAACDKAEQRYAPTMWRGDLDG